MAGSITGGLTHHLPEGGQDLHAKARELPPDVPDAPPHFPLVDGRADPGKLDTGSEGEGSCPGPPEAGSSGCRRANETSPQGLPEHVTNGSVTIRTAEAFRCLLQEYPDHPDLLRMYAGRLTADGRTAEAIATYARAAGLFFSQGRLFLGWMSKVLEWRLQKATKEQLIQVQRAIESARSARRPLDDFVRRLTLAERVAFFSRSRLACLPAGSGVVPVGPGPIGLCLVVSGLLSASAPHPRASKPRLLQATDMFGFNALFPEHSFSHPEVRSTTRVELITIPRAHLAHTFRRLPGAEKKFIDLCRHESSLPFPIAKKRKGERYFIRTLMNVSIPQPRTDTPALELKGFSHEISLSGVSFIPEQNGSLHANAGAISDADTFVGREVRTRILAQGVAVEIQGRIVRIDRLVVNGHKLLSLAIQFPELTPQVRGMIFTFADNARVHLPVAEHQYLFSCPLDHHWRI